MSTANVTANLTTSCISTMCRVCFVPQPVEDGKVIQHVAMSGALTCDGVGQPPYEGSEK